MIAGRQSRRHRICKRIPKTANLIISIKSRSVNYLCENIAKTDKYFCETGKIKISLFFVEAAPEFQALPLYGAIAGRGAASKTVGGMFFSNGRIDGTRGGGQDDGWRGSGPGWWRPRCCVGRGPAKRLRVAAAGGGGRPRGRSSCVSPWRMMCLWTGVMEIMRRSGLAGKAVPAAPAGAAAALPGVCAGPGGDGHHLGQRVGQPAGAGQCGHSPGIQPPGR